ncbi:hypothetical protein [Nocardioides renjunii]|uniref:hypothetical protein n=1 Tax=Nocardioides renjunii TaxID=3095075 RepID=UPI002AFFB5D1|nr:hypothetical protein [Nocardioides sp. S-34]WQQ23505.1 hypothetical protein SHK17_05850 [Nocardioides sp. S-34]
MAVTFGTGCFDQGRGWEAEPRFRVATDTVELAADALLVAAERFMMVGESGTEHSEDEDFWDEEDRGPSSTAVSVDEEAAYVAADTDAWLSRRMADTMKSILVQELTRVGVSAVVTADYDPIRGIRARRWPARTS